MRLIDADALADALFDKLKNYPQWVANVIANMPEVVVRCKDCKHLGDHDICPIFSPKNDFFCGYGDRK